jgi:hypothetical protein
MNIHLYGAFGSKLPHTFFTVNGKFLFLKSAINPAFYVL